MTQPLEGAAQRMEQDNAEAAALLLEYMPWILSGQQAPFNMMSWSLRATSWAMKVSACQPVGRVN